MQRLFAITYVEKRYGFVCHGETLCTQVCHMKPVLEQQDEHSRRTDKAQSCCETCSNSIVTICLR